MKPSSAIARYYLDPQTGTAFILRQGQVVRLIDVEGEQVADLICYAQSDVEEYLSSGRTIDYNGKIFLSTGDVLYSNQSSPMLTILDDRVGYHNFLYAPCSQEMFRLTYGMTGPHPNCLENLVQHLAPFGIRAFQIPTVFNAFMRVGISEHGELTIKPPLSKAGDYIDIRAEMDLIVGISACSAGKCNNYRCTAIEVMVYVEK